MSTDTTTPAELAIPPAAADTWFTCGCTEECGRAGYQHEALALVVAAELRRLADEPGMGFMTGPHDVSAAQRLRSRADDLARETSLRVLDDIERRLSTVEEEFQPDTDYSRGASEAACFIRTGRWPQEQA